MFFILVAIDIGMLIVLGKMLIEKMYTQGIIVGILTVLSIVVTLAIYIKRAQKDTHSKESLNEDSKNKAFKTGAVTAGVVGATVEAESEASTIEEQARKVKKKTHWYDRFDCDKFNFIYIPDCGDSLDCIAESIPDCSEIVDGLDCSSIDCGDIDCDGVDIGD